MGKAILFLIPYPLGEAPSQRFRFEQYLSILQEEGFTVSTQSFWSDGTWSILYQKGNFLRKIFGFFQGLIRRFIILLTLRRYSFVFIHREVLPVGPPLFEWIIGRIFRKKIIYDFDDAIWIPNTSFENKFVSKIKWHSKVGSICRWSHRISCGNEYLATFARTHNQGVCINPSTIDTNLHNSEAQKINKADNPLVIGWTGSHSTITYLHFFEEIFIELEKEFQGNVKFLVIADKRPKLRIQDFQFISWSKSSEIKDLQKIDIGIMPLSDNPWTRGKCGFKILQYMALGIPSIASPVGVNRQIITQNKNGFLCESRTEWLTAIRTLISSSELRKNIGSSGRAFVMAYYSVHSNRSNFLSLFE